MEESKIQAAYGELISAMNAVAGCSLLSMMTNPDLMPLIEKMRDAEFKMTEVLKEEGLIS